MKKAKEDLRVQKTKLALSTALFFLLEKNSFSKITVNDICSEALVSRSAFYSHFEDKYVLLAFSMKGFKNRFIKKVHHLPFDEAIHIFLLEIKEDVTIFKNLLMVDVEGEVIHVIRHLFHQSLSESLKNHPLIKASLPCSTEMVSLYYVSGITSVIILWISNRMKESTQEMAQCLCLLLGIQKNN